MRQSFPEQLLPSLKALRSLEINVHAENAGEISGLPLLSKLVVASISRSLTLHTLPSLEMLQLYQQQLLLKAGLTRGPITIRYDWDYRSILGLEEIEYELFLDQRASSLLRN